MNLFLNMIIYLSAIFAASSIVAYCIGNFHKSQKAIRFGNAGAYLTVSFVGLAIIMLFTLLVTGQFQYEYVYGYTTSDLAFLYKISALWAGKSGSLLTWSGILCTLIFFMLKSKKLEDFNFRAYAVPIVLVNVLFFLVLLIFADNPFSLHSIDPSTGVRPVPTEGFGLNPLLQNFWMIIHPITLLLGYAGFIVPLSLALTALIKRDTSNEWVMLARRWILVAWLFLTVGNVMGGKWAYAEQGWGGYWAWDPVENASLMPWFTGTALLHSIIVQERKNMLKIWNVILVAITYLLTIFGTFLVRSGIVTSVHAFSEDSIGMYFLLFMIAAAIYIIYLLTSRAPMLKRDQNQIESYFSKEGSFFWVNVLFIVATFVVFVGTTFPITSPWIVGSVQSLKEDFYTRLEAPIMLCIMTLLAYTPLVSWRKKDVINGRRTALISGIISSIVVLFLIVAGIYKPYALIGYGLVAFIISSHLVEVVRGVTIRKKSTDENLLVALYRLTTSNRRRYGGYAVHVGIAIIMMGVIGSQNYKVETTKTIAVGKYIDINNYRLVFEGFDEKKVDKTDVVFATLIVQKDGATLQKITPEVVFYNNAADSMLAEVALLSSLKEDLYIVIRSWEDDGRVTFMVEINPMVSWIWMGTIFLAWATMFAVWGSEKTIAKIGTSESEDEILADVEREIMEEIEKAKQLGRKK